MSVATMTNLSSKLTISNKKRKNDVCLPEARADDEDAVSGGTSVSVLLCASSSSSTTSMGNKKTNGDPLFQKDGNGVADSGCFPLPDDFEPSPRDVICGRGRGNYNAEGNIRFRQLVRHWVDWYTAQTTKVGKSHVLAHIAQCVQQAPHHCRFVKLQPDGSSWVLLGETAVREKVGHIMREAQMATKRTRLCKKNSSTCSKKRKTSKMRGAEQGQEEQDVLLPYFARISSGSRTTSGMIATTPKGSSSTITPMKRLQQMQTGPNIVCSASCSIEEGGQQKGSLSGSSSSSCCDPCSLWMNNVSSSNNNGGPSHVATECAGDNLAMSCFCPRPFFSTDMREEVNETTCSPSSCSCCSAASPIREISAPPRTIMAVHDPVHKHESTKEHHHHHNTSFPVKSDVIKTDEQCSSSSGAFSLALMTMAVPRTSINTWTITKEKNPTPSSSLLQQPKQHFNSLNLSSTLIQEPPQSLWRKTSSSYLSCSAIVESSHDVKDSAESLKKDNQQTEHGEQNEDELPELPITNSFFVCGANSIQALPPACLLLDDSSFFQ